jgi:hypothetical protein
MTWLLMWVVTLEVTLEVTVVIKGLVLRRLAII